MPRSLVRFVRTGPTAAAFGLMGLAAVACSDETSTPGVASAVRDLPLGSGFDFWVLSLSWSPSYCAIEGDDANRQQCGSRREAEFVVHGLWPQFETEWPEYCESDEPERVPDDLVEDYLDIIPSAGLIGHQWRKHGTCSGLSQDDYLATARAAWDRIAMPEAFSGPDVEIRIDPDDVEASFMQSNAGMAASGIAVTCDRGFIEEVRICLTKGLEFRSCEEVDRRACRAAEGLMPVP